MEARFASHMPRKCHRSHRREEPQVPLYTPSTEHLPTPLQSLRTSLQHVENRKFLRPILYKGRIPLDISISGMTFCSRNGIGTHDIIQMPQTGH
ncbi:hypothetical protein TNCV_1007811 [Trichonephila clavipes]|nr:hypothetical protein TNCV_1007811 [Trichonephila clavipes]